MNKYYRSIFNLKYIKIGYQRIYLIQKNILKFKIDSTVSDLYNIKRLMRPEFMKGGTEVNKETELMNISRIS